MTREEADRLMPEFRSARPRTSTEWRTTEAKRVPVAPEHPAPVPETKTTLWVSFVALIAFLAVVWVEFGIGAAVGTFLLILVALLIWAAREFRDMLNDEDFV